MTTPKTSTTSTTESGKSPKPVVESTNTAPDAPQDAPAGTGAAPAEDIVDPSAPTLESVLIGTRAGWPNTHQGSIDLVMDMTKELFAKGRLVVEHGEAESKLYLIRQI